MSFKKVSVFVPNPSTTRGISTKISASKGKLVYANGRSVIIRNLNNPSLSVVYSGHVQNTTVARISPSGYYCASADVSGTVRVWDIVGEDQTLKGEYKAISGRVNDLAWDGESKRIIAVGDGKEKFGHAFMMDSGTSTGEIAGHAKPINAVSIRHQRPFRAATAADDGVIVFHQGVPFKYDKTIKTHTKFVQDIRYSASGERFASVGSDIKIFIYDGKTGDTVTEFTHDPHKGTITSCAWSSDDTQLITSSADCTVKLWDVQSGQAITTWKVGTGVDHQQVGNTWNGIDNIVSLSLSGDLSIFDPRQGSGPARTLKGPQRSITAIAPSSSETFLTGTADGRVLSFSTTTGEASLVEGDGHTNFVTAMAPTTDGKIVSAGYDDQVREIDGGVFTPNSISTASQPKSIAIAEDSTIFVVETNSIEALRSNQKVSELQTQYTPSAVAASRSTVAIGSDDRKVYLHDWNGSTLRQTAILTANMSVVTALAFSPDGSLLAAGDSNGKIYLFDVKEKTIVTSRWSFHTARVNSLDWHPDGQYCASGSLDTNVYVWSVQKPMRNIPIKNAGSGGIDAVRWLEPSSGKLASAGSDGCVRIWEIIFQA